MDPTDWQRAETQPGMYHFPTEANREAKQYCAGCEHGEQGFARELPNRVRCIKMRKALRGLGRKGEPDVISTGTPGCEYWAKRV